MTVLSTQWYPFLFVVRSFDQLRPLTLACPSDYDLLLFCAVHLLFSLAAIFSGRSSRTCPKLCVRSRLSCTLSSHSVFPGYSSTIPPMSYPPRAHSPLDTAARINAPACPRLFCLQTGKTRSRCLRCRCSVCPNIWPPRFSLTQSRPCAHRWPPRVALRGGCCLPSPRTEPGRKCPTGVVAAVQPKNKNPLPFTFSLYLASLFPVPIRLFPCSSCTLCYISNRTLPNTSLSNILFWFRSSQTFAHRLRYASAIPSIILCAI